MLRSCSQLVKGLTHWPTPRCRLDAVRSHGVLHRIFHMSLYSTSASQHLEAPSTDYALPNDSWSPDMLAQFNKFTEMTRDGTWKKLPSYRNTVDHFLPEKILIGDKEYKVKKDPEARNFLRSSSEEGVGFEYAMFLNKAEKRLVCVFQPGPHLQGPPGFAHGGSTATILDTTLGVCASCVGGRLMTANLNINYKSPIPLGSVVLVESKVDRVEGRKVFMTGHIRSVDGKTLHAEATGLFIQLQSVPSLNQRAPSTSS